MLFCVFLIFAGLAHLVYYFALRSDMDVFFWMTLNQTNIEESFDFIKSYPYNNWLKLVAWLFFASLSVKYLLSIYTSLAGKITKISGLIILVVFGAWLIERAINDEDKSFIAKINKIYPLRLATSALMHDAMAANMDVVPALENSESKPKADMIVLVIGESASASRWSSLGYSGNHTTRPLDKFQSSTIVKNVVSNGNNTAMTMPVLLTGKEVSQFSSEGVSTYLDYAKKAGFHTLTYSNQNVFDANENFFHMAFIKRSNDFRKVQDGSMDEALQVGVQEAIKYAHNGESILLTLHTIGSHPVVSKRYPKSMEKFNDPYDNSILYTSSLLEDWINLLQNHDNKRIILIYISDHGLVTPECGANYSHGFSKSAFQVPLFIWANENFLKTNKSWFDMALKEAHTTHDNRIFFQPY